MVKIAVRKEVTSATTQATSAGRKPGRPPQRAATRATTTIRLALVRQVYAAMVNAAETNCPPATRAELTAAINGLLTRFGPALAPDYLPPAQAAPGRPPISFKIVKADGTECVVAGQAKAARAMGLTKGGFAVALARGKGRVQRKVAGPGGAPSIVTATRL